MFIGHSLIPIPNPTKNGIITALVRVRRPSAVLWEHSKRSHCSGDVEMKQDFFFLGNCVSGGNVIHTSSILVGKYLESHVFIPSA